MAGAKEFAKTGFLKAVGLFFEYDTPKIVHIRSKKVGIINRIIQLAILGYIIGYAIVWEKGYQEVELVESATTTKLKGTVYSNFSQLGNSTLNNRIWDVADYVIPPQENDAFFVMTNVEVTPGQTQRTCPEDYKNPDALCDSEADCPVGVPIANGNGVRTGNCTHSKNASVKVCEIYAWCDVEIDSPPLPNRGLLEEGGIFTVLIKNNIEFPKFGVKKRNILETQNSSYLIGCKYNSSSDTDRLCPIFELRTIAREAGTTYKQMASKGGVISINIRWDCNLDRDISYCQPEYTFSRLDPEKAKIAKGYNFRYANYYKEDGVETRDLYKAYGIRFVIKVSGQAGKFSFVPLLLNLGSGLGLLAIATVLCDIVVMYALRKGPFYRDKKYFYVTDDDAFQVLETDDEDSEILDLESQSPLTSGPQPEGYNSMVTTPMSTNGTPNTSEGPHQRRGTPVATGTGADTTDDDAPLVD